MQVAPWINRSVIGIIVATFFSDVGHEMVTAILPMYLTSIGLGAAALGTMEGLADLLGSLAKLSGGAFGHHVERKKPWVALGYLVTALGTSAMGFVRSATALVALRASAWAGRGFRSPLRDFMLADEVEPTHYGRAYGVERSADMLGALTGPLLAIALVSFGVSFRNIILIAFIPSMISALSIVSLTRDRLKAGADATSAAKRAPLPREFWLLLVGVLLFGLGDFSRTFLILLANRSLGSSTAPVFLYVAHNAVSALAAYPIGGWGDRTSKLNILIGGYVLGVLTNLMLAHGSGSLPWLLTAMFCSGIYIAVEETLEKAAVADLLPREQRSLGFGILAATNAVGDVGSSIFVGWMLEDGQTQLAFAVPAALGLCGVVWIVLLRSRMR